MASKGLHATFAVAVLAMASSALMPVCAHGAPPTHSPLTIEGGRIAGKRLPSGVKAYLGIPYAAPPLGALRWREARPVAGWSGVRSMAQFGSACEQNSALKVTKMNEDCLTINVWAPGQTQGKLPVIVYVHGGGFNGGSSAMERYDGEPLAKKGVVFVSFNYRVGIMANLALPELTAESPHQTSGALIHLDQIAALQWIHRNIAKFGGDPGNVTLMGQSSSSIDLSILQASPLAHGLFERIVALSGAGVTGKGAWPAMPLVLAEQEGLKFEAATGAKDLAELRGMPVETLLAHAPFSFPVGADGYVLPVSPAEAFKQHRQNDVPIIVCNTRDEGFSALGHVKTLGEYRALAGQIFGKDASEVLGLYPAATDQEASAAGVKLANEGEFAKQMALWARLQAASGKASAYLCEFAHGTTVPHGADVPYWLGTLDAPSAMPMPAAQSVTAADRALSAKMSDVLIAFARTGVPKTKDVEMAPYARGRERRTVFDDPIKTEPFGAGLDFFIDRPDLVVGIGEIGFPPLGPNGPQRPPVQK